MKTLLLMRHGKAERYVYAVRDHQRDLEDRGIEQAEEAAESLQKKDLIPDRILCSDALRAKRSAEILREKLTIPLEKMTEEHDLYLCSVEEMLSEIRRIPEDCKTLLVVGHNPTMEYFTDRITGGDCRVKTSEIRGFQFEGSWNSMDLEDLLYLGEIYSH